LDLEKITAHAFTHLLKHHEAHIDELHKSIQDAHNLRDEEMPMVHDHLQQVFQGWRSRGLLMGMSPGMSGQLGMAGALGPMIRLNNAGREEALQFLEQHGYPPPA
jgi:hypothetical protein